VLTNRLTQVDGIKRYAWCPGFGKNRTQRAQTKLNRDGRSLPAAISAGNASKTTSFSAAAVAAFGNVSFMGAPAERRSAEECR